MKPWVTSKAVDPLLAPVELRNTFFSTNAKDMLVSQTSRLFGATQVDISTWGRQDYFEFKFNSLKESTSFKSAAVLAGICAERQITIIGSKQEYSVVFMK